MIKGPANRDRAELLKLWAMLVNSPRNTAMPFIDEKGAIRVTKAGERMQFEE